MEELASELGCKVGELLTSYLGSLWGLLADQRRVGMGLKSGFKKGLQCGRANTSLKGGGLQ